MGAKDSTSLKTSPVLTVGESSLHTSCTWYRNPSTKTYNVGSMVNRKLSDIEAEIAKCDLLCANCHGIRTYEEQ